MSACDVLIENASAGAGPALRAVDCLANETAAAAFGRLFGTQGALLPALTILLTLFIAFFAISLLTGRGRLSISALTPRMMTLGIVLTLATSWMAWQGLIWNLAVGAPDQVAGILLGAQGSATQMFADRIDMVFAAITEAGQMNGGGEGTAQAAQGSFTPPNLMWLGAVMLLLGTVGILVTARIALAVLMAIGPIFVVMSLFSGTRGLTAGWLRGLVLTAVTPLFVVAGGSMILELLVPVVVKLRGAEGIDPRAAMALFLIAAVHVALMAMVMKVSGTIVSAWQVFGLASGSDDARSKGVDAAASTSPLMANAPAIPAATFSRTAPIVSAASADASAGSGTVSSPATAQGGRTVINHVQPGAASGLPPIQPRRARGIGSRFAARPSPMREMMR
ncbi:MAG: type IV secretion system protein [Novosphingobium sp.]